MKPLRTCVVGLSMMLSTCFLCSTQSKASDPASGHQGQATQSPSTPPAQPGAQPGSQQENPAPQQQTTPDIAKQLQVFVYPGKGQSPQQQHSDEQQCFEWAQSSAANQAPAQTAQDSSAQKKGAPVAGGTAKGAAAGAAIGAIAGDAGQGAAIGATGGAMAGARKRRQGKKEAEKQQQEQQAAQKEQANNDLRRAFSACMEPKGYSVK